MFPVAGISDDLPIDHSREKLKSQIPHEIARGVAPKKFATQGNDLK
jgi:hypothetical protein